MLKKFVKSICTPNSRSYVSRTYAKNEGKEWLQVLLFFVVHHIGFFPNGNKYIKVFGTILFCHDWEIMILFNLVAFSLIFANYETTKKN